MDADIAQEFKNLNEKFDTSILAQAKLCGQRKGELDLIDQRVGMMEQSEDKDLRRKAVKFSYDRLVVTIVVGLFGIFEILKHLGAV